MNFNLFSSLSRNDPFKFLAFKIRNPQLVLSEEDKEPYLIHIKKNPVFSNFIAREFGEAINQQFNRCTKMEELEYLLEFNKPCFIEPRYGWLITEGNIAFRRSLPYGITERTPLPHYIYYKRKRKIQIDEGLPLFYNWFNYWHFYNDIIGSLMVLDKLNFDKSIPIIVPEKALQLQYVKDFFTTAYAKNWNWLFVHESRYVYLKKAYIVKGFSNVQEQFLLAKKIFDNGEVAVGERKVFINRANKRGRNIINIEEILPTILEYGYEVVDTDGMSVYEQKALCESSKVILAIHGAALTNMLFRSPNQCTILEMFPNDHYPAHYYWLAQELGFKYDALSGASNENGSFIVDKENLKCFLDKY